LSFPVLLAAELAACDDADVLLEVFACEEEDEEVPPPPCEHAVRQKNKAENVTNDKKIVFFCIKLVPFHVYALYISFLYFIIEYV
jgi:hypothetical protein